MNEDLLNGDFEIDLDLEGNMKVDGKRRKINRNNAESVDNILKRAEKVAKNVKNSQNDEIKLSVEDEEYYNELYESVELEIIQLKSILLNVEAKEKERKWLKNKKSGEIDENKITDLIIGEKNIFKKRGKTELISFIQKKPKKLVFLIDCSASMAYFNNDGRLDRLCATVILILEALTNLEHKYLLEIIGHSGETTELELITNKLQNKNKTDRLIVIKKIIEHCRICKSGDNTLKATELAMNKITNIKADDYFLFLFSDANLIGYGIKPKQLGLILTSKPNVNCFAFFIAEPESAKEIINQLPKGMGHIVLDNSKMPFMLKEVFVKAMTSNKSRL